jgi:hypothetical protein
MARSLATMHARSGDARPGGALQSLVHKARTPRKPGPLANDVAGVVNLALVWTLIGFIIIVTILAKMIGPVFTATSDVNEALNDPNVTTGDESADAIKPVFGIVIGLSVVLGIVAIVLGAAAFRNSRK